MQSKASTVKEYLAELPPDRRQIVQTLRKTIKDNLRPGYAEGMAYGMIGFHVPHSVYPPGYHCDPKQPLPFAALASQKNAVSIYLFCLYTDPDSRARFERSWRGAGRRLDMGKSCIRIKKLEDVPLDVLGEEIRRVPVEKFIAHYESQLDPATRRPRSTRVKKSSGGTTRKAVKKTAKRTAKTKTAKRVTKKRTAKKRTSK